MMPKLTPYGWECDTDDEKRVLDIITFIVQKNEYPLKYEPHPMEALEKRVLAIWEKYQKKQVNLSQEEIEHMVETEKGNKQMFGSDEGFVEYFYSLK